MTLDREIRLSADEIHYTREAVRRRLEQLRRSIITAERNRLGGQTIQHGTMQRHYEELDALNRVRESLDAAAEQIKRRIVGKLEAAAS
jgi:hypothetical protein